VSDALDDRLLDYACALAARRTAQVVSVCGAASDLGVDEARIEAAIGRLVKAGRLRRIGTVPVWEPVRR